MSPKNKKDYPIEEMKGVDEAVINKLKEQEIETISDFLNICVTRNDRQIITDILGIHEDDVLTMANMADLMRIDTITPQWAWLLEKVGVDTIPELGQRNPEHLFKVLDEYDIAFIQGLENKPAIDTVSSWTKTAKVMKRFLKY